jgi:hypothetical protein
MERYRIRNFEAAFYVGIDTLVLGCVAACERLNALRVGFEDGSLQPYPVEAENVFGLDQAMDTYRAVFAGASARMVLTP